MNNAQDTLIIIIIALFIKYLELEWDNKNYSCPEYCRVIHTHIQDDKITGEIEGG